MSVKRINNTSDDSHVIWTNQIGEIEGTHDEIEVEAESVDIHSAADIERLNSIAMSTHNQREAQQVVGTSQVVAERKARQYSERELQADRTLREQVAASGGAQVTTELRGTIGEKVAEALRLDRIDAQFSKVSERVTGEIATVEVRKAAEAEVLDALLDEALAAAGSKRKTPDVLQPFMAWVEHERPVGRPEGYAGTVLETLQARHAADRQRQVQQLGKDVAEVFEVEAERIFETAARAAETLTEAGLSTASSAEDVVDSADEKASQAWRNWRLAVSQWRDLQSSRRWVSVVIGVGFDPRDPQNLTGLRSRGEFAVSERDARVELETRSWRTQFDGLDLPEWVTSPHAALAWRVEQA